MSYLSGQWGILTVEVLPSAANGCQLTAGGHQLMLDSRVRKLLE